MVFCLISVPHTCSPRAPAQLEEATSTLQVACTPGTVVPRKLGQPHQRGITLRVYVPASLCSTISSWICYGSWHAGCPGNAVRSQSNRYRTGHCPQGRRVLSATAPSSTFEYMLASCLPMPHLQYRCDTSCILQDFNHARSTQMRGCGPLPTISVSDPQGKPPRRRRSRISSPNVHFGTGAAVTARRAMLLM